MFPHEIVNAEMQCHSELVHFEAFAVSKPFALKSLQFPDSQKRAFYVTWLDSRS
jgi:hypothetical protein